jgi:hypothetical protein
MNRWMLATRVQQPLARLIANCVRFGKSQVNATFEQDGLALQHNNTYHAWSPDDHSRATCFLAAVYLSVLLSAEIAA